jgi:hypothetical protein
MDGVDEVVLSKMPLAEAVLTIWRLIADEDRLQTIFDRYRGRCYERSISFTVDGIRKRWRGEVVAAVENGGAQACHSVDW